MQPASLGEVAALAADPDRLGVLMAGDDSSESGRAARHWYRSEWLALDSRTRQAVVNALQVVRDTRVVIRPTGGGEPVRLGDRRGSWSDWSPDGFSARVQALVASLGVGNGLATGGGRPSMQA